MGILTKPTPIEEKRSSAADVGNALVYFSADSGRPGSKVRNRYAAISTLVRILTRSRLDHVAISYRDLALDPAMPGSRIWFATEFVARYPGLVGVFEVPLLDEIQLRRWEDIHPKRPMPVFWHWLTRGLIPSKDCVSIVRECLRTGGIAVPREITTPRRLFEYLTKRGFEYAAFE